ncbi:hypothetical protein [Streptacidiphilus melanogenes]|uniref:hypothetical protein n=1 Tax=Streptacidiphilus melanogenes TaxID=411235 RepID=UPI0005AB9095|nr:hypothetical protein [Streptacidiphilus melanogenes]
MSRIDKHNAPSLTLIRFQNLMGALVVVIATELGRSTDYRWHCQGCHLTGDGHNLAVNRDGANEHAAACRALPQPTPTNQTA